MVVVMQGWRRVIAQGVAVVSAAGAMLAAIAAGPEAWAALVANRPAFMFDIGWLKSDVEGQLDMDRRHNDAEFFQVQIVGLRNTEEIATSRMVMLQLRLRDTPNDPIALQDMADAQRVISQTQGDIQTASCQLRQANGEKLNCSPQ